MRLTAPAFLPALLLLPLASPAQERQQAVVELPAVETPAQAPNRSAFGRVMDVMISALMEQQQGPGQAASERPAALQLASRKAPAPARSGRSAGARAEPEIEISLGERFALPPAGALARQASETPE